MKSARRDRLDLAAQAAERQAVDAREQPAVAPLDLASGAGRRRETAAQNLAFGFEPRQRRLDQRRAAARGARRAPAPSSGPVDSSQPRSVSVAAASRSGRRRAIEVGDVGRDRRASGYSSARRSSAARPPPRSSRRPRCSTVARRASRAASSKNALPLGRPAAARSASAARRAARRHRAPPATTPPPPPRSPPDRARRSPPASGPSVRRICTARARRSSSGASSR